MHIAVIALYLVVLSVLALYGFHRAQLLYLYWKHKDHAPAPHRLFDELPRVTVQLPMFNEMYVAERLIESGRQARLPGTSWRSRSSTTPPTRPRQIAARKVERARERGYDAVYIHRVDRTGYKAGALEQGPRRSPRASWSPSSTRTSSRTPHILLDRAPLHRPQGRHGAGALGPHQPRLLDAHEACRR
jgi:hypothetical protein